MFVLFYSYNITFFLLQIIETENMMDRIVNGLSESSIKVRLAAVRQDAFLIHTNNFVMSKYDAAFARTSANFSKAQVLV